jgi:predicted 3-demethylubiquinone-9 3-methyltransferase (glyoxalase superfamily)
MERISPCLWFDTQAHEAAEFYVSVFKDAHMGTSVPYPPSAEGVAGKPAGSIMMAEFTIGDMTFTALNGGPLFKFSEAISFQIPCDDQAEVDYYWEKLTADGGEESMCGWLKDKFGLSWQVVPKNMGEIMGGSDPEKNNRAMAAMLQMKKLDIAKLEEARDHVS